MILGYKELKGLAEQFAGELPNLLASHHQTRDLAPRVHRLLEFAETRFTVAVVGQMKAGKSSLLNALIGKERAVVGVNETTATTNRFTYGTGESTRRFRVHWKGRPPEYKELNQIDQWVGESSLARETRMLEFFDDADFLKTADVVDTPGTRSLLTAHQEAVDEYLADKADADTRRHGGSADAILYVVPPVARQSDMDLLEDFQRTTRLPDSPPHNSLAVVHKWEVLESEEPYIEAQHKAERIFQAMGDFISGALPVSAPLGRAAEQFPDSFWESVLNLAGNTGAADFEKLLLDDQYFIKSCAGCPLDIAARKKLREEFRLPWPSLKVLLRLAKRRVPGNPGDLRQLVQETSGLARLRQEIQDRFFARADMLKKSKLLAIVWEPCDRAERLLRNYKLDINLHLEKADRARGVLKERMARGDVALLPARDFIQSAAGILEQDMSDVGEILRRVDEIVLKVKNSLEQMERDLSMLDLLDQSGKDLTPKTLRMLRCLFGRAGGEVPLRLSFFTDAGKTAVSTSDLDEAIAGLRLDLSRATGKARTAVENGIDGLEQIANSMEKNNIPEIPLTNPR